MPALLLFLALANPVERWGLQDKDAGFFERIETIAEAGANTRRARAYLEEFAKQPDGDVLRGLGCLFEREESTPEQKRNAHVLLLVLTGRDVKTPDADVWFGVVEPLTREYRTPKHPSKGEVRAAILLAAQSLYLHLDKVGSVRLAWRKSQTEWEYGPPSVGMTCLALVALHRAGLPKNDPALQLWLARCRQLYGSKFYEELHKKNVWFQRARKNYGQGLDCAGLAWANAELGGDPIRGIDKELYEMLSRAGGGKTRWNHVPYWALSALRAMKRAGVKLNDRKLAETEAWLRRAARRDMEHNALNGYALGYHANALAVCVRLRRPDTTAQQLRQDPIFRAYLQRRTAYYEHVVQHDLPFHAHWGDWSRLADLLDARMVKVDGRAVDITLHDLSYAIRRQKDDGSFVEGMGRLYVASPLRTAEVLLGLTGGLRYR